MLSVVHEPAQRMAPLDSRLEPSPDLDLSLQETAKRLESRVESASGPLSEPARVAKGLESARRPLFEPPRAGCQETRADSSRVQSWARAGSGSRHPGLEGLEPARLVHNTIPNTWQLYYN